MVQTGYNWYSYVEDIMHVKLSMDKLEYNINDEKPNKRLVGITRLTLFKAEIIHL